MAKSTKAAGGAAVTLAAASSDLQGDVSRSFRLRALSGGTVSVDAAVDLTLLSWSASVRMVYGGEEFEIQAGPHGLGEAPLVGTGGQFTGELSVAGGLLRLAHEPLTAEEREFFAADPWIGYWTTGEQEFDLLILGGQWSNAEAEGLHQLSAMTISVTAEGIAVSPAAQPQPASFYGTSVSALISPLGGLQVMPRSEAEGLIPTDAPALPLRYGALRRVQLGDPGTEGSEELLFYTNNTVVAIVRDTRFSDLDQPDRLAALQDLNLRWT